ncbi:hypothetical protein CEW46_28990, partial [Bacillus cereus]
LTSMTQTNNYLYFNMLSSYTVYLSDLQIGVVPSVPDDSPQSFKQVGDVLRESSSSIRNSRGSIERMIAVGHTYFENVDKLSYGNLYTTYDTNLTLVNGKNQIDCSSFANVLIHGIPYENTRYAGKSTNIDSNIFFTNINGYKFRFANQIAKYAYERGYSFVPNKDFSNVEAGDILFFSWTNRDVGGDLAQELRENAFMKIDHVAAYLHKKNDSYWSTLQFDNGISTVYYDATNEYMSQCVLAARFPYANVESMYSNDNMMLNGDVPYNVSNTSTIAQYKLNKPLQKGRYYTFIVDGTITTPECYYVLIVNGKTVYSDNGKTSTYNGQTYLRFPYTLDDVSSTITLAIGAAAGVTPNRSAQVNWSSMYEGYVRNKKQYVKESRTRSIIDLPLTAGLSADITTSFAPYYKYIVDGNIIKFNINLPLNTVRTGNLEIANIGVDAPKNTQRLPLNLIGENNEAINGILQVAWDGKITVIPYVSTTKWKVAMVNGEIFKD